MRGSEVARLVLVAPFLLYVSAVALPTVHPIDAALALGLVVTALPLVPLPRGRSNALGFALAPAALALVGLYAFLTGTAFGGWMASVDAGILLASPLWFLAVVLQARDEPGTASFGLIAGGTVGVLLLATVDRTRPGAVHGPAAFLNALGAVLHAQAGALATLLQGQVPSAIPLSQVADPAFALLAVVAAIGLVAPWLGGPQVDALEEADAPGTVAASGPGEAPLHLPPVLDHRLDEGSLPSPSPGPSVYSLAPVLVASACALGFVVIASLLPAFALLAIALGVLVATFVFGVSYIGRTRRRLAAGPPAAGQGAPAAPR